MKTIDDGGPAFPGDDGWTDRGTHYPGMSLRDWFAGMALNEHEIDMIRRLYEHAHPEAQTYSLQDLRYFHAEKMMEARKKYS